MGQRPSKATSLKVLEGNRGKRPLPDSEPKPNPKAPKCPAWLDSTAKSTWKSLAPKLVRIGLLTEIDGPMFALMCQQYSRMVAIGKFINKENTSLIQEVQKPDPDGGIRYEYKQGPYPIMEKQYAPIFRMFAKEFGLTPVGRAGLAIKSDKTDDDGADLLS